MRSLLLLFVCLFLFGSTAIAQVNSSWLGCTTLQVCPTHDSGLFPSNPALPDEELEEVQVILRNDLNGGIIGSFSNVTGCVTFSGLDLETSYEIEVKRPVRFPVTCSQVFHEYTGAFLGCRGVISSIFEVVESGPGSPSAGIVDPAFNSIRFTDFDVCYADANSLSNPLMGRFFAFGETNYRIDIESTSLNSGNTNYVTTNWQGGQVPDGVDKNLLLDVWKAHGHSSWKFWANNEFRVILAVTHSGCNPWTTDEITFTVRSGSQFGCRSEEPEMPEVSVYPNPFTDQIRISDLNPSSNFLHSYEIVGLDGREYASGVMLFANHGIDTSKLPAGAYVIRVMSNDELLTSQKVVKQ